MPEELIIDTLSRLPVKSLLRFKAVSKNWYALIRSPYFTQLHLDHANKNPKNDQLFIVHTVDNYGHDHNDYDKDNHFYLIDFNSPNLPFDHVDLQLPYCRGDYPPLPIAPKMILVGSCNGIVCVMIDGFTNDQFTYLWNPATKHTMVLPPTIISSFMDRDGVDVSLGFGFDPVGNDYKVVRVLKLRGGSVRSEVYSVNESAWREVKVPESFPNFGDSDACVKGVLFWVSHPGLVTFDLNNEVFEVHHYPEYVRETMRLEYACCVREYKGSVVLMINTRREDSSGDATLWSIDDVCLRRNNRIELGPWSRKFTLEVGPKRGIVNGYLQIGYFFVKDDGADWVLYNPVNQGFGNLLPPDGAYGICRHVESLVSIAGSGNAQWKATYPKKDKVFCLLLTSELLFLFFKVFHKRCIFWICFYCQLYAYQ